MVPPTGADEGVGCRSAVISSADLLARSQSRADAGAELWGLHVRAGIVTLLIGETSAGKTVFLHNFGFHMASDKEFLGIAPPRALRVLHVDFESYDAIYEDHLGAIGTVEGWDFLDIDTVEQLDRGPTLLKRVENIVRDGHYDIVIFDPLMEAYPVLNENDNSLAQVQMLEFRKFARTTRTGVIVVHNSGLRGARKTRSGKETASENKFLGRGATIRPERADVSINFTEAGSTERLLTVAKARGKNKGERIRVRFAGTYGYELVEQAAATEGVEAKMRTDVLRVAREETEQGHPAIERKTFMAVLDITDKSARAQALDRALKRLSHDGTLYRRLEGGYSLASPGKPMGPQSERPTEEEVEARW